MKYQNIVKIHYFSDGCAAQYKNRLNFINLCHHKEDFGIEAEWHFFATSHGKNACDGIGGSIKRSLTKASLMRSISNQILNAVDVFNYCLEHLSANIAFFFVTDDEVKEIEGNLETRFVLANTVAGTRRYHRFVPQNTTELKVYETSYDTISYIKCITKDSYTKENLIVSVGNYVTCVYDNKLWVGLINDYEKEFDDFMINFLHPHGFSKQYKFPVIPDYCNVPKENILMVLKTPNLIGGSRISYSFDEKELQA